MGRPLSKAKYYWLTDSEQVPWGKGEKHPDEGSEIEPIGGGEAKASFNRATSYMD